MRPLRICYNGKSAVICQEFILTPEGEKITASNFFAAFLLQFDKDDEELEIYEL